MDYATKRRVKVRKACAAKERQRISWKAFSQLNKPMSLETLQSLQPMDIEKFRTHLGSIFPLILERVSGGNSIASIAAFLGMSHRSLERFLQKHPRLDKAIREARKVKQDAVTLEQKELEEILS
jgi:hypothetical protein